VTDPFALEELAEVAAVLHDGGDPWAEFPEVAQHLLACERCRAVMADLVTAERGASAPVDADRMVDGVLVAALRREDPATRLGAVRRLAEVPQLSPAAVDALRAVASDDADGTVRAAAQETLRRRGEPEPA
jgi:hypothetical protein